MVLNLFKKYDTKNTGYLSFNKYKLLAAETQKLLDLKFPINDAELKMKYNQSGLSKDGYLSKNGNNTSSLFVNLPS